MKLSKPTLIPNWRRVLRKAWSLKLMALAGLLTGCQVVIEVVGVDSIPVVRDLSPGWRAAVVLVVIAAAFWARMVQQDGLNE